MMYLCSAIIICCLILPAKCEPIYYPTKNSAKPPTRQESLNWGSNVENIAPNYGTVQQPSTSSYVNPNVQLNPLEKNPVIVWPWNSNGINPAGSVSRSQTVAWPEAPSSGTWDGLTCPKGATGAFPYIPDCKKFLNCWKGRGMPMVCAPGTLFNPVTLECDFPSKVNCITQSHYQPISINYSSGGANTVQTVRPGNHYQQQNEPNILGSASTGQTVRPTHHYQYRNGPNIFGSTNIAQTVRPSYHYQRQNEPNVLGGTNTGQTTVRPSYHYQHQNVPNVLGSTNTGQTVKPTYQYQPQNEPNVLESSNTGQTDRVSHNYQHGNKPVYGQRLYVPAIRAPNPTTSDQHDIQKIPALVPAQTITVNHYSGVQPPYTNKKPGGYSQYPNQQFSQKIQYDSYGRPINNAPNQQFNTDGIYVTPSSFKQTWENPPHENRQLHYHQNQNYSTVNYRSPSRDLKKNDWSLPDQTFHTSQREDSQFENSQKLLEPNRKQFDTRYNTQSVAVHYDGRDGSLIEKESKGTSDFGGVKCPVGYTGLYPHPECAKYLTCSHGKTFIMVCSNGTVFNPRLLNCDYPHKIHCSSDGLHVSYGDVKPVNEYEPDLVAHSSDVIQDVEVGIQWDLKNKMSDEIELPNNESHPASNTTWKQTTNKPTTPQPYMTHPDNREIKGFFINNNSTLANEKLSKILPTKPANFNKLPRQYNNNSSLKEGKPNFIIKSQLPLKVNETTSDYGASELQLVKHENSTVKPSSHIFQPNNSVVYSGIKYNGTLLGNRQVLRLRGGPTYLEGFVEIQLAQGTWGLICDQQNQWAIQEANIVCKNLGFSRGAEVSWQGKATEKNNNFTRLISADSVKCYGHEKTILECALSRGSLCDIERDAVWVRCYSNPVSQCLPGETSFEEKCYSLVIPSEDTTSNLVGFSQGEALAHCQQIGGRLLSITSQKENDYISEWLIRQNTVDSVMTSGVGVSVMKHSLWIWEGSEDVFAYHNWWPGWQGGSSISPETQVGRALCIVARKLFPCPNSANTTEPKICDADYYFWDVEDCGSMSNRYPYICERPADKIGCTFGNGGNYLGKANVTQKGAFCLPWDTSEVLMALQYKISETEFRNKLLGHNYCRNVGGTEIHPWCYVQQNDEIVKELCDIPECSQRIEKSGQFLESSCNDREFSCDLKKQCIPLMWVCDGEVDCPNGSDEINCTTSLDQYSKYPNSRLIGHDVEKLFHTPLYTCAKNCNEAKDFKCRSFSFSDKFHTCILSDSNIGLSGSLASNESSWSYYEMTSRSLKCDHMFVCENGKCINKTSQCNGHNDCGDRSDERNCTWEDYGIELRLTGGGKPNEGMVEIKVLGEWGLICDDQFDLRDADVICRHIGFPLGASEQRKHSDFKTKITNGTKYFVDDLECRGNETRILECEHNGWGIHNCGPDEAAGVVCKVKEENCGFNYWQCEKIKECIPLGYLCDNVEDCTDNSDEDPARCKSPLEMRLVGHSRSDKSSEGRLEIRRFGVWGTVCDDDFGVTEAEVVCNYLGYSGPAKALKEAAYGIGDGVIWLDQVHCAGNETNVSECMHENWGQTNCRHNEDVSVSCFPHLKNMDNQSSKKVNTEWTINEILPRQCGIPPEINVSPHFMPKVVSGFETEKGSYPWQASIRVKSLSGRSSHWCGAVIISQLHVLTAGHCLRDYIKSTYFIRAGDYDTEVNEDTEQDLELEEIWIHQDIDKLTRLNNDIALVKVKAPGFNLNKWVSVACLPNNGVEYSPDNNCTISGWGSNGNPGSGFARTLHATWLNILPQKECKADYVYGDSAITEGMFCAGSLIGGSDSCQGDSGGPFLCLDQGNYTIYGITSWGHGCGRTNSPGVYTKVSHYIDWIHEKILKSMNAVD